MALPVATLFRALRGRRGTGYRQSPDDPRDHPASARLGAAPLPAENLELTRSVLLLDQGATNSCTDHAIDAGVQGLCSVGAGPRAATASPLDPRFAYTPRAVGVPYYNGRALDGLEDVDGGAYLRSVLKAYRDLGSPPRAVWPLRARTVNRQPPAAAYRQGRPFRGLGFERLEPGDDGALLAALAANRPVVGGFGLGEDFFDPDGPAEVLDVARRPTVFHALPLLGYRRTLGLPGSLRLRVGNSWGPRWRDGGWCWFSGDVVAGAMELWVLRGWS